MSVANISAAIPTAFALFVACISSAFIGPAALAQQSLTPEQQSEKTAIDRAITSYGDAFVRGDLVAIVQHCNVPFMVIRQQEVRMLPTAAEVEDFYGGVIRNLKERGYSHSTRSSIHIKLLGQSIALVSAGFVRHKTDGTELETIGATYLLRKVEGEWRIVVLAAHPAGDVMTVE